MKITYKGDYALKAILDLCHFYGSNTVVPITDISQRQNIPVNFLEHIMLTLKKSGFVDSKRGIGGGFVLLKSPKEITIGDIVQVIEGPIEPIACAKCPSEADCGEEDICAFREVWLKVTKATTDIVDHVTFTDIMRRKKELDEINNEYMYYI